MYWSTHSVSCGVCGFHTFVGDGLLMPLLALPVAPLCLPFLPHPTLKLFSFPHFVFCFVSWWPMTVLFSSKACAVHHNTFSGPSSSCCCCCCCCCPNSANQHVMSGVNVVFELLICLRFVHILYFIWVFAGCLVSHVTWGQCSLLLLYSI